VTIQKDTWKKVGQTEQQKYLTYTTKTSPSMQGSKWMKSNILLMLMPRLYYQLVNLSIYQLLKVIFSYCMNKFWKFKSAFISNKVRGYNLHHAYPVTYQDRKINEMRFWPFPPEFSYVSDNSRSKSYDQVENVPVKVLNLGEMRYLELLFMNGRSHLLRNVID